MLGYNIECRLKVRLMEKYNAWDLQHLEEVLTKRGVEQVSMTGKTGHRLDYLFDILAPDALKKMQKNVRKAYNYVVTWSVNWRYAPDRLTRHDCEDFFQAVDVFRDYVEKSA